jgi:hypothetical protein
MELEEAEMEPAIGTLRERFPARGTKYRNRSQLTYPYASTWFWNRVAFGRTEFPVESLFRLGINGRGARVTTGENASGTNEKANKLGRDGP